MNKYIPHLIYGVFMLIIGALLFTPKQKIIYKTRVKERVIDYQSITDSITSIVLSQPADTQYVYIDSTVIYYRDSLIIKDSLNLVPYSVVSFNYSDSLLSADVSTYFNTNGSKYDFKYTLNPSKYGFNINYTSPDTIYASFYHHGYFKRDSIYVLRTINNYIDTRINEEKNEWYNNIWFGFISGTLLTSGVVYLVK